MTPADYPSQGMREAKLPIEHLEAELLAAPFAYESAFSEALFALDPSLPKKMHPLWRQTELRLLHRFPGMSIDELIYRRDRAWFGESGDQSNPVRLGDMLRGALHDVIAADALRIKIPSDGNEAGQRHYWRWLTFSLPADLLLAAVGSVSEKIDIVSARLRNQLAFHGFSEPHLHLKGAIDFPTLWGSLMRVLASPDPDKANADMLESPGAELDEGRKLAPLLLRCALARLLLAEYLRGGLSCNNFNDFLNDHAAPRLHRRFGAGTCQPLWRSVYTLAGGSADTHDEFPVLRDLYARLLGPNLPTDELDPLASWMPSLPDAHADFSLTRYALDYLSQQGKQDELFAQVFWQTVRGRVLFYRHVVQRPLVPGLQWFTRTYARLSKPRYAIKTAGFVQMAAELSGAGLRSLEVRVVPVDQLRDLKNLVDDLDKAAMELDKAAKKLDEPAPEVGLVLHFPRTRGSLADKGLTQAWSKSSHDDPKDGERNPSGYRFSGYYRQQRTGAATLANLLVAYPRMLERVRGIDLCTDELAVPLWVLLPLIRHVRRAADRATSYLHRQGRESATHPLLMTVHAGEDFVHLLGGIRRVGETIELLELGEGSRIGHAVALGVDVRDWAAHSGRLVLPKGERMLDLLWAWRVARRIPDEMRSWLPWLEQELSILSTDLFKAQTPVATLNQWWESLHTDEGMRMAGFPDGPHPRFFNSNEAADDIERTARNMVFRWLTDSALFRRSQELMTIGVKREIALVATLQAHVRQVIGSRGIAVEINPSSNLLIGHLGDLTSHPLWRLCPPAGVESDAPKVRVCIGSDDPITFATSLPEEYQLLADALNGAGVAGPDVDAWLKSAIQCGLTAKFTVPRSPTELTVPTCTKMLPVPF